MLVADWYFDFVSPYSYFSWLQLSDLSDRIEFEYHPILFAALLDHWEQKGPAEIAPKRVWTYRRCTWWAKRHGLPFRLPTVHPFNPLPYLRLAHAAGCTANAIDSMFRALWTTGADPRDPTLVTDLARELGLHATCLADPKIKDAVRERTTQAIALGVFGVPTCHINGQLFWGSDSLDFIADFLDNPALFDESEMQRASALPMGAQRTARS